MNAINELKRKTSSSYETRIAGYRGGRIRRKEVKTPTPKEDDEAVIFATWLSMMRIPHSHIANEVGGSTNSARMRAIKAKRMGQTPGVWDYELFIPIENIDGEIDAYQEVRVELKRKTGGRISEAQKEWGKIYELAGIPCAVCKGADEAIKFVDNIRKEINE